MTEIRYGGKWTITTDKEKNRYDGQLTLNDQEGLIHLELYHFDSKRENMFANNLIPKNIESISGMLSNGAIITLMDCTVFSRKAEVFFKNTIILTAKYALNGIIIEAADQAVFEKFSFDLSYVTDWADLNKFETKYDEDRKYSIVYKGKSKVTLYEDTGKKLILEPDYDVVRGKDDRGKITLSKAVKVILECNTLCTYEQALTEVQKVMNLVSFGTGNKVDIIKIEAFNISLNNVDIGEETIERPIEILTSYTYRDSYPQGHPYFYLFTLRDLVTEDNNFAIKWFNNYEKLEPVIELYLDLYRYNMTHERAFLNIIQALETYHTRFKANDKKEYEKRSHEVVSSCPPYIREQHLECLFGEDQKKIRHVLLKGRLYDLFLADFEIMFMSGYKAQYDFILKAVATRHYYTHYDEKKKDKIFTKDEIEESIYWLKTVLEYHLLKGIGFSQDYLQNKIVRQR